MQGNAAPPPSSRRLTPGLHLAALFFVRTPTRSEAPGLPARCRAPPTRRRFSYRAVTGRLRCNSGLHLRATRHGKCCTMASTTGVEPVRREGENHAKPY